MLVKKSVQFNNKHVPIIGKVVGETDNCYIVDFSHEGVKFRGMWPKQPTQVIGKREKLYGLC